MMNLNSNLNRPGAVYLQEERGNYMRDNRMRELNLIERIAYKKAIDDFIEKMNEQSEIVKPVGWSAGIEIITMSTVRSIKEELIKEEEF